jgi:hypothetical protein
VQPVTDDISFKLRSPSRSALSSGAKFHLPLKEQGLDIRVMRLAAQILQSDPVQHSITISFDDVGVSPSLITDQDFRSFAHLISIAMPSWPTLLTRGNSLVPLLVLAPISNLSIGYHALSDTWKVIVPRRELEIRFAALAEHLGRGFTADEQKEMLWSLVDDLGE